MLCILTAKSCDVSQVIWFQLTKHHAENESQINTHFIYMFVKPMVLIYVNAYLLLTFSVCCSFLESIQTQTLSSAVSARQFSERQGGFSKTVSARQGRVSKAR